MTSLLYTASAILFLGALYPYTFYPISVWLYNVTHRRSPLSLPGISVYPDISIVFCAHNEAGAIASKLGNLSRVMSSYPGKSQAIAYFDGCSDDTVNIAHDWAASARGLDIEFIVGTERSGKSCGMNAAVARASGEIVVFTDANVLLDDQCLEAAAKAFRDSLIGCICGHLLYINPNDSTTAEVGSFYWRFEEWIKKLESICGSTVSADGSLFALRRTLFRPVPHDIIDDMYSSMGALIQGYRVVRVEEFIARETHVVRSSDEFRRKVRIACRAVNCMRLLWPDVRKLSRWDRYKVVGHKIMRWLTIYNIFAATVFLVFALALDGAAAVLGILMLAQLGSFAAGRAGLKPFSTAVEILLAFTATGIGVYESLNGERYQTWTIAQSSRSL